MAPKSPELGLGLSMPPDFIASAPLGHLADTSMSPTVHRMLGM